MKIIGLAKQDIENQGSKPSIPGNLVVPELVESIYPAAAIDSIKASRRIESEYFFDADSPASMPVNHLTESVKEVVRHFFGQKSKMTKELINGSVRVRDHITEQLTATNYQLSLYREGLAKSYEPSAEANLEEKNKAWAEIAKHDKDDSLNLYEMVN